jgi:hypothetical protein
LRYVSQRKSHHENLKNILCHTPIPYVGSTYSSESDDQRLKQQRPTKSIFAELFNFPRSPELNHLLEEIYALVKKREQNLSEEELKQLKSLRFAYTQRYIRLALDNANPKTSECLFKGNPRKLIGPEELD